MNTYSIKRFSCGPHGKILNTRLGLGFDKNRKYDTDLDRLGRMDTAQSELRNLRQLNMRTELRKARKELSQ